MLQELASQTGAVAWAIGSMLFFLAAWAVIVFWVMRKRPEEMAARARMPLEGDREEGRNQDSGVGIQDSGSGRQDLDAGEADGPGRGDHDAPNRES